MRPLQRRTMALCIFALTFILFYEARGKRLVNLWGDGSTSPSLDVFRQQALTGTVVLVIGGALLFLLRRSDEAVHYTRGELMCLALGLGLLIGTLAVSWLHVRV